ncbi:DUF6160 family protein [Acinetobacter guerrae]|uniref:DUF6160 family protein n=1 Tax=Acinetobacter guerrae TaxID=1843371 RepID=UPI00125F5D0C|nr:DUF6160 family protein [Acinetobacter guerrae]
MDRLNKNKKTFNLSMLTISMICVTQSVFALQELNDKDLRQVNGQDGVNIQLGFDQVNIEQAYWEDKAGKSDNTEQTLRATGNTIRIKDNTTADTYTPGVNLKLNTGSKDGKTGLDIQATLNPFVASMQSFKICDTSNNCNPGNNSKYDGSIGSVGVVVASPIFVQYTSTNGIFSATDQANLKLGLNNINLFLGQKANTAATVENQLILKNFNFNLNAKGFMYVDATRGLIWSTNQGNTTASITDTPSSTLGYVDLDRADDPDKSTLIANGTAGTYGGTNSGINIELMTKKDSAIGTYDSTNAKGIIRVGASGRLVNSYIQVRGTNATGKINPVDDNSSNTHTLNNVLGFANQGATTATSATVMGSTGIGFRMHGEFTSAGDAMLSGGGTPTTLEIGGAGRNSYGFEFGKLSPLVTGSTGRAYFDSGNVYFNLANTQYIYLPENSVLRNSRFGGVTGTYLTDSTDYKQQIHNFSSNPYSLIMAIRGMDFQAISKQGRFTSNAGVITANSFSGGTSNTWGLALPIYNLNANLATYATNYTGDVYSLVNGNVAKSTVTDSQRLGLALALSTEGRNADGSKTTSILVIDGGKNSKNGDKPMDYYLGLRNIDMLLRGYGSMGFENGNVNVTLPDLLMVMSAEIAGGYLPGAKFRDGVTVSPANNFTLNTDVLLGLKLKLLGDMNFSLIPNNAIEDGTKLSVVGDYNIKDGAIQLSDPVDNSMIGLDDISGKVRFNNSIAISKRTGTDYSADQQGNVSFNYSLNFNPDKTSNDVFRVRDVNLYPPSSSAVGQRLGEVVMTGGRLNSSISLAPRN